jgi:hypothetical protein
MVTLLTASLILIAAFALVVYFQQRSRPGKHYERSLTEPPRFEGLFSAADPRMLEAAQNEAEKAVAASLLSRARSGELAVLQDLHDFRNRELYEQGVEQLMQFSKSDEAFRELVSYIARDETLQITPALAERFLSLWQNAPDTVRVAEMLHVAALSDSPTLYERACERAVELWQEGKLSKVKADDLAALIEGEYWILSAGVRQSGAGYVLKRCISDFRKQLVSANNR